MQDTSKEYDSVINECRSLFIKKMSDYGSAWRILRLPSLTDQIFIKAQRIRQLQEAHVTRNAVVGGAAGSDEAPCPKTEPAGEGTRPICPSEL